MTSSINIEEMNWKPVVNCDKIVLKIKFVISLYIVFVNCLTSFRYQFSNQLIDPTCENMTMGGRMLLNIQLTADKID